MLTRRRARPWRPSRSIPGNRLQLAALGDTLFHDLKGTNVAASTSKSLVVALGDRIICRVASAASAASPTRLELQYTKEG